MIKINLLAERKRKQSAPSPIQVEGMGSGQNLLLVGILIVGVLVSGGWWWKLKNEAADLRVKIEEANQELQRLADVRRKRDEYTKQKELLQRKIDLITSLKKQQAAPVHILDQISKNLPDFLWLESRTAKSNAIKVSGKATNYNAVSRFHNNLSDSGHFSDVTLGRTFEVNEGVSFSLDCRFGGVSADPEADAEQG